MSESESIGYIKQNEDSLANIFDGIKAPTARQSEKVRLTLNQINITTSVGDNASYNCIEAAAKVGDLETIIKDVLPTALIGSNDIYTTLDDQAKVDIQTIQARLLDKLHEDHRKMRVRYGDDQEKLAALEAGFENSISVFEDVDRNRFSVYMLVLKESQNDNQILDAKSLLESIINRYPNDRLGSSQPLEELEQYVDLTAEATQKLLITKKSKRGGKNQDGGDEMADRDLEKIKDDQYLSALKDALTQVITEIKGNYFPRLNLRWTTELLLELGHIGRNKFNLTPARVVASQWWNNFMGRSENGSDQERKVRDSRIKTEAGAFPIAVGARDVEKYSKLEHSALVGGYTHVLVRQKLDELRSLYPDQIKQLREIINIPLAEPINTEEIRSQQNEIIDKWTNLALTSSQDFAYMPDSRLVLAKKAISSRLVKEYSAMMGLNIKTHIDEQKTRIDSYDLLPLLLCEDEILIDSYISTMVIEKHQDQSKYKDSYLDSSERAQLTTPLYNSSRVKDSFDGQPNVILTQSNIDYILNFYSFGMPNNNDYMSSPFSMTGDSDMNLTVVAQTGLMIAKMNHTTYDGGPIQRPVIKMAANAITQSERYVNTLKLPDLEVTQREIGMPQLEAINVIKIPKDYRKVVFNINGEDFQLTQTQLTAMATDLSKRYAPPYESAHAYLELVEATNPMWKSKNPNHSALQSILVNIPNFLNGEDVLGSDANRLEIKKWIESLSIKRANAAIGMCEAAVVSAPLGPLSDVVAPLAAKLDPRIDMLRNPEFIFSPLPQPRADVELLDVLKLVESRFFASARSDVATGNMDNPKGGIIGYTNDPDFILPSGV
ncbi:MAG: hypothetical protein M3P33_01445, partial [bacterium]|nr:hypothetical protein [bacterium]